MFDKLVDPVLTSVDPTLPLKSEVEVVDLVSSVVDPTLISKSEFQVVNSYSSMVDPTLPFKSEVKVVESMSSPPNPTLSPESVKTEVVTLTQYSSCPSLPIESEMKTFEVFVLVRIVLLKGKLCMFSTKPSPSSEVISFDWSNLIESHLHSSVPL